MSFFESSSIRGFKVLGSAARPPLAKIRCNHPALGVPPRPGGLFSGTTIAFCALGVHFQRPLSHSVLRSVKNTWESAPLRFLHILPLMLAILPVLLAILAPTCPTSALKMPDKWHFGANIAKKVLQPPLQAHQKTYVSISCCRFSAIQPMCQNNSQMLPTCSRNLPS